MPEILIPALDELAGAWSERSGRSRVPRGARRRCSRDFVGRPTPITMRAAAVRRELGDDIWLKREDLNHTGAHKINNALGQALLARRMGKERIIAETGAGQHGVATATACALLRPRRASSTWARRTSRRQAPNVFADAAARRRGRAGHDRQPHAEGRDQRGDARLGRRASPTPTTSSARSSGPHPFPMLVRDFQRVIGDEATRAVRASAMGRLPDVVVACVGGGSNAIGMFDRVRRRPGGRARRRRGRRPRDELGEHAASLTLRRARRAARLATATCCRTTTARSCETHSISAGLDYPGVGPSTRTCKDSGRAAYVSVTDDEALDGVPARSRAPRASCRRSRPRTRSAGSLRAAARRRARACSSASPAAATRTSRRCGPRSARPERVRDLESERSARRGGRRRPGRFVPYVTGGLPGRGRRAAARARGGRAPMRSRWVSRSPTP